MNNVMCNNLMCAKSMSCSNHIKNYKHQTKDYKGRLYAYDEKYCTKYKEIVNGQHKTM